MAITNRKRLILFGLLLGVPYLIWLSKREPIAVGPITFVSLPPSETYVSEMDNMPVRKDLFSIKNLNRLDSASLLTAVAQHACQVTDSIDLKKYAFYGIQYYENGVYLNDSTPHRVDRPLLHVATEIDAFVYLIDYDKGKLNSIVWYKTGEEEEGRRIAITEEVKKKFTECRIYQ